jgi:hypothetical protein
MEGAGGISACCIFARVQRNAARCSHASHLVPRIVQTTARPKKFAAPLRIPRLLEGRFRLRVRYTGSFFSACVL